jgi:hypothetical protein
MDYSDFNSFLVPNRKEIGIVYAIGIYIESGFKPFYVGQSSRHVGRFGDYLKPNFTAATDFKVGKAIEFLTERGFKVEIKYKVSTNRKLDEKELIKKTEPILNGLKLYKYKTAVKEIEVEKIKNHIQIWIDQLNSSK